MWDWAVWGALAVAVVATVGGLVLLAVRILQAWRDYKRVRRHVVKTLESVAAAGERAAVKAERAADTSELDGSMRRLSRSLAQLSVLRRAVDEVQDTVGVVTAFTPRK